jgi:DNA replication and repair protein RecF
LISTDIKKEHINVEKQRNREIKIKKNEKHVPLLELIKQLPIHILNHTSFKLLNDGPSERRKFIDWGLFHVEHLFYNVWVHFIHALQQRNNLLRKKDIDMENIEIWNNVLVEAAQKITQMREMYVAEVNERFKNLISDVFPYDFNMKYYKGWDEEYSYAESLRRFLKRDCKLGYTTVGPHRAEIQITCNSASVQSILSNGQTKLVIFIMKMAQDVYMNDIIGKKCIYLIDDLAAELDAINQKKLLALLSKLETQVFISVIDELPILPFINTEKSKMFHVEQGVFIEK